MIFFWILSKNGFELVRICRILWRSIFFGPNDFLYSLKYENTIYIYIYISYFFLCCYYYSENLYLFKQIDSAAQEPGRSLWGQAGAGWLAGQPAEGPAFSRPYHHQYHHHSHDCQIIISSISTISLIHICNMNDNQQQHHTDIKKMKKTKNSFLLFLSFLLSNNMKMMDFCLFI